MELLDHGQWYDANSSSALLDIANLLVSSVSFEDLVQSVTTSGSYADTYLRTQCGYWVAGGQLSCGSTSK